MNLPFENLLESLAMNRPRRSRPWIVLSLALLPLAGCVEGEDVDPRTIARARRVWDQAKPSNYDLEWTVSGAREAHYLVAVRDGSVQSIESVGPDGKKTAIHPPDPSYYSVEGLFHTLEDEADQVIQPRPFGLPEGTIPKLRFDSDPRLGYPRRYRRSVDRPEGRLALDVLRIDTSVETSRHDDVNS